jgi:hypothetical protein
MQSEAAAARCQSHGAHAEQAIDQIVVSQNGNTKY